MSKRNELSGDKVKENRWHSQTTQKIKTGENNKVGSYAAKWCRMSASVSAIAAHLRYALRCREGDVLFDKQLGVAISDSDDERSFEHFNNSGTGNTGTENQGNTTAT